MNRKFSVGDMHTPYYFPSGNSFMMGVFGLSGDEIGHMGLYMMKPLTKVRLMDITYPTLDDYKVGLQPQIYRTTLCNDD